ncbi:MAG: HYC_CC_PP family protein [Lutibacter sp.]
MKRILTKILSFFLTILVLFSSVSFTVEKHLCGGQVYSESIFGKAEKCGINDDDCELEANNPFYSEKSCCEDEIQFINGSIFEKEQSVKLNNKQQQDFTISVLIDNGLITKEFNESTHFKNYLPPANKNNFNILYQVFRI